jgi:hypothetical protein
MTKKPRELSDAHRRINGAFGKMRYGSMCNFSGITKDDTDEDALAKIAGNLERLGETLVHISDKATANERKLGDHKDMFRALGDLLEEVAANRPQK